MPLPKCRLLGYEQYTIQMTFKHAQLLLVFDKKDRNPHQLRWLRGTAEQTERTEKCKGNQKAQIFNANIMFIINTDVDYDRVCRDVSINQLQKLQM
jgi:hypothetical protein